MTAVEQEFIAALLDPALPVPDGLSDAAARPAGRRFDVYRNNVAVSLRDALRTGFPVISKLVGQQNMDRLAGQFLRRHPPSSPLMMHYGAAFPGFLADTAQLAHLGYLADVARLELAIRRSYHAADAKPIAPELLGAIPAEALMETSVALAPAVQVIRSPWPIHDIWRFNTDNAPLPAPVAQDVLITRPGFDPVAQVLPPGAARWIDSLINGQTIGAALDTALVGTPEFDMAAPLTLLLQGGALTSLNPKGK